MHLITRAMPNGDTEHLFWVLRSRDPRRLYVGESSDVENVLDAHRFTRLGAAQAHAEFLGKDKFEIQIVTVHAATAIF